jgi:hypothetical protein
MKRAAHILPFIIALFASPLLAQGDLLTDIRRVGAYEVKNDGFVLESNQNVSIHAVAATDRYRGVGTSAWILDKATRTVV